MTEFHDVSTSPGGRRSVLRQALSNDALRMVLAAFVMFEIGEWAIWIALLVWGYSIGGVRGVSEIAVVQLVPGALLAAPAAALFGRLRRSTALCLAYAAQAVSMSMVGILLVKDSSVIAVGAGAAVCELTMTLTRPLHNAVLPEISRTTGDLTAGNAATGALEAVAYFAGPFVSGVLIAASGPGVVLLVMSGLSGLSVLLTSRLRTAPPVRAASLAAHRRDRPLRLVARNPAARLMMLLAVAEFVLVGMMDVLLVALAFDVLGLSAAGPGILNSAVGVGGIAGAAVTFVLIGRPRLAGPLVLGAVLAGTAFGLAGLAGSTSVALALVGLCGAGKLFYDVTFRTFVQRLLPDRLLTAMFGLQESAMMASIAVGTLVAPVLVHVVGAKGAFGVAGLFLPLIAVGSYRTLRRLDAEAVIPDDVLALLLGVPVFAVLPPRIVERLARDATCEQLATDAGVVREGDLGARFYVIESGRFRVTADGRHLRDLGAGDWFGEIALLRDVPRTATVTAVTAGSVWIVERDAFLSAVNGTPRSIEIADVHIRDTYD